MQPGGQQITGPSDGDAGTDRQPTAEPLGQGDDVGRDAVVLMREERAGAAHPGLHLVE